MQCFAAKRLGLQALEASILSVISTACAVNTCSRRLDCVQGGGPTGKHSHTTPRLLNGVGLICAVYTHYHESVQILAFKLASGVDPTGANQIQVHDGDAQTSGSLGGRIIKADGMPC